jgi:hypothetical protein
MTARSRSGSAVHGARDAAVRARISRTRSQRISGIEPNAD